MKFSGLLGTIAGPCRHRLLPRNFHAYCVGTDKSGTKSLAAILQKNYRSAHEPTARGLISNDPAADGLLSGAGRKGGVRWLNR